MPLLIGGFCVDFDEVLLVFLEQDKVSMEIGQHFMEGKLVDLDEPFLVMRNVDGQMSTCGFVEKKRELLCLVVLRCLFMLVLKYRLCVSARCKQWCSRRGHSRS